MVLAQKFKVKDKRIHPNDNLFTAKRKKAFICHGYPVFENHFK